MKALINLFGIILFVYLVCSVIGDIKADMYAFELHQLNNATVTQCVVDSDSHEGLICD